MSISVAAVLLQFSRVAASSDAREGILPLLASAAVDHVRADAAAVVEVVEDGSAKIVAVRNLPEPGSSDRLEADTIGGELGEELRAAYGARFATARVQPMVSDGGLFGALVLLFSSDNVPDGESLELAAGLSDLAATALNRAAQLQELRRAYADLRASQEALVRSERLRALGQMAAGISHDLKNILNPISLYMQVLRRAIGRSDAAKAEQVIESVQQIVHHGAEVLERLREFSRQSPVSTTEIVEMNRLAHEAAELAKPRIGSHEQVGSIQIEEDFEDPPKVSARSGEVVSALLNLIINAIDAMQNGGTVVIRTRAARDGALVEVEDQGPGMPPEVAERVFEPFFTTKGRAGTGLGLAMVHSCVQRHGGHITLETQLGRGTRIAIWLPAARTAISEATPK